MRVLFLRLKFKIGLLGVLKLPMNKTFYDRCV